ncbi:MAG TPA: hypothetical protein VGO52_22700 [Hyphomonadaceae bacterium]|nr:hypothetical protein [Hyphomonadaceae bacterium]
MTILVRAMVSALALAAIATPVVAQTPATQAAAPKAQPPKGFDTLGWLAGTRYVERSGVKSYETWTGISGGLISGSVASATNGGLAEFFVVGPNEQGVYGLKSANTTKGLTNWSFRPIKSITPGKIVFADATGSFSIEATPDGGIHNIATRVTDGKEAQTGEWFWLPIAQ